MPSVRELTIFKDIDRAISSNTELASAVKSIIEKHPSTGAVFQRVIDHFSTAELQSPSRKRIKSEHESNTTDQLSTSVPAQQNKPKPESSAMQSHETVLVVRDLSFVTPLRKKLTLHISPAGIQVISPGSEEKVELDVPFEDISFIALLPVPEKAAKLYNFCFFRLTSEEAVVFTVPDTPPKTASGPAIPHTDETITASYKSLLTHVLNQYATNITVSEPSPKDFTSAIPQPHRKHEPAVHITAHRGSKEGYLFFLPEGLIYGFKRPMLYMPLRDIVSITYNDILQRTFNLTVTSSNNGGGSDTGTMEETEFSMIDIAEHDRVDGFVRAHQLHDASLSELRRAKPSTKQSHPFESEISKAADEIAASVTGHARNPDDHDDDDEEEDGNFEDDESHGGSTRGSSESEEEQDDQETGDHDIGDVDTDEESEDT